MTAPLSPYQEILSRLRRVVRRKHLYGLYRGIMLTVAVLSGVAAVAVGTELLLSPGTAFRTVIFFGSSGIAALTGAWFILRPLLSLSGLLKGPGTLETAAEVGDRLPAVRDRLVDALEMYGSRDDLSRHYSTELIDGAFSSLWEEVRGVDIRSVVSDSPVKRSARYAAAAAGALLVFFLAVPSSFSGSAFRILHFGTPFESGPSLTLEVEPGDVEIVRGQPVTVTVRATGGDPGSMVLNTRPDGRLDFEPAEIAAAGPGVFRTELSGVRATTEYYASSGEVESGRHTITVVDRPVVKSFALTVHPPAYTRLPPQTPGENIGDITALPGSRVEVRLTAGKDVAAARIVFGDSVVLPMTVAGTSAAGSFRVAGENRYRFHLEDGDGLTNPDPIEYTIRTLTDEYPFVEIESPGKNLDITGEMTVNMALKIRDDYGFSRLRLLYRLEHSRYEEPARDYSFAELPLGTGDGKGAGEYGTRDVYYQWDLSGLSLAPEDVVSYHAEVWDNDNVSGPKSSKSASFLLRLPSLEEVLADAGAASRQNLETMQRMTEELRSMRESLEELNRDVRNQRNQVDWQQQKKAEQLAERYDALRKKAEETSRAIEEMARKMDENSVLSDQTLSKYEELRKLMEELDSPELRDALRKLQESMKQMTPEEMRQAMQQMTDAEEQFRRSLERTVELLKRIHIEQKIDELIARAGELRKRQEGLREQGPGEEAPSREEMSERQSDLGRDAESLEKETKSLEEKMGEFSKEMPMEEMGEASGALERMEIPRTMQQSSSEMRAGRMQNAREQQQRAGRDLQEFSDMMQDVADALRERQMKQVVDEMRRQIQNLLDLSKSEESIKEETSTMDPNSQRFREQTRRQQETLEDLGNVADAMTSLSKKTFAIGPDMGREMGKAMKSMGEALREMEQRNPGGSAREQKEAMGSMNSTAMMMQGALEGMMNAQGQMGMAGLMGRLSRMAGMQQGINEGTRAAAGGRSGEQGGGQQSGDFGRLAQQQGAVRKSLQDLAREAKLAGEFSKLLGDLDRVAEEMLEVQTNLAQGEVNPETLQKQERILSRMLESQRSMRERDYEQRRTAESGTNVRRPGPAGVDFTTQEGKNRLREELFQVREGKYSRDYQELIRKYFEQLEHSDTEGPK